MSSDQKTAKGKGKAKGAGDAEARAAARVARAEAKAAREVERARDRAEEAGARASRQAAKAADRAEQAGAKAAERAARAAEGAGRGGARAAQHAGGRATDRAEGQGPTAGHTAEAPGGSREESEPLIWLREEPVSRRPAHTRADIARAALEIADSEGFEAVSMRRVAQKLGAGTMTLYHYVRNKDELITLMSDQVMADILVPADELSGDWRAALTQIAIRTRGTFAAHHWIFERLGDGRPGPNGMRHFEQSLQAVASLDLDREQTFELIGQIDDYVFGFALREVQELEEHERGWPPEVVDFLQRELDSGDYPLIAKFFGDDAGAGIGEVIEMIGLEGRFERGLDRLLDGIESSLPKRK